MAKRESEAILGSEELVRRVNVRESQKCGCSTTDFESETSIGQGMETVPVEGPVSPRGAARKVEQRVGGWLREVEENCSALCLAHLKSLATDYQRLL